MLSTNFLGLYNSCDTFKLRSVLKLNKFWNISYEKDLSSVKALGSVVKLICLHPRGV